MATSLLSTKFFTPPLRENGIRRRRLTEKLRTDLDRPGSFALISGPAGFGKTTLLSDFVREGNQPVAWITLDEGDNDFSQFWTYLITACQSVLTSVGSAALELLSTTQSLPEETAPTLLINDLVAEPGSAVLVLDDFHKIQNPSVHDSLVFLLDHLPDNLYPVFSTRIDPPWPLARYRARNRMIELRVQDLRFSLAETADFLNRTMGLRVSTEDVAALEERTEGWIAGLQLAALSLQRRDDTSAFIKNLTGSQVYVAEYLVEEVLRHQPDDIQMFLLQTSLLKQMNAGLCESVTRCADGSAVLRHLHQENIFVISMDEEGSWYRYHQLFADLLQARLQQCLTPEEIAAVHQRAASWYEQNGYLPEAINHTLASRDFEKAGELVYRSAPALIYSGRIKILREWLDVLTPAAFQTYPQLVFYAYWIDILQNKASLTEQEILEKETLLGELPTTPENDQLRGELMAVICRAVALSGRTAQGIRLAQEALAFLPADNLAARARALSALSAALGLEGQAEKARQAFQESISLAVAAKDFRLAAHTLLVEGLIRIYHGQLKQAEQTFRNIINLAPVAPPQAHSFKRDRKHKEFFPAGQGYIGLGRVHLDWNHLDEAEGYLEKGLDLCRQGGLDGLYIAKLIMSRLRQARGDFAGALEELQMPQMHQRVDGFDIVIRKIQLALAENDLERAQHLAAPLIEILGENPAAIPLPLLVREVLQAVVARLYLALGDCDNALQLLDQLQETAEPGKRNERLIEAYLLRALISQEMDPGGPSQNASQWFARALELGEPEDYALVFLEAGPGVKPLLRDFIQNQAAPAKIRKYARRLLEASDGYGKPTASQKVPIAGNMVEQLTPREMEVLELLACGDSNQEIAEKLVITVRTVKKHTSNIYAKLGASSRIQAVTLAREFDLLPAD